MSFTTCERCTRQDFISMSYFNTDMICEVCLLKEEAHPKYKEAVKADHEEVKAGNYNFPGIGLPDDLKGGR